MKHNCKFCKEPCDGKLILRNPQIETSDGSDFVICSTCLNLYANSKFEELEMRIPDDKRKVHRM